MLQQSPIVAALCIALAALTALVSGTSEQGVCAVSGVAAFASPVANHAFDVSECFFFSCLALFLLAYSNAQRVRW